MFTNAQSKLGEFGHRLQFTWNTDTEIITDLVFQNTLEKELDSVICSVIDSSVTEIKAKVQQRTSNYKILHRKVC